MFAIVNIKGSQYRVSENDKIYVPKLKEDPGSKVTFDDVLMFSTDENTFEVGQPKLEKKIEATVIEHVKDDKVIVFKKKRRKGYKVRRGHRQQYTQISIDKIS
ncbi:MAG: 50S ribosomal protein L21 [Ignavibacteriaceae bacterium]|jgi:LSU ribosomal protein L21P|nr:MAG: 50S ribosomal protein L21 [Chlorobiota bacterium]KXK06374.1 MAG: 50S ribosomal protein L21 [Chlorobi bacterium OLB4]MBV6399114.1 50S ribosomal protein L21 [Ignavibacteria bacterium]MCC6885332.1 50S ribosomal protein L21 [Ignavibacteriales bacterium]MCE7953265.1 50S ribosomal protein L21 [Chlorobi bacterium CHB7]MDL1887317.1 50S ribosomal protein L21 [Ignavibacteria bacterium CHB1]MEB2330192.1 50S ribosomal protein L21 [Ignavibacteriaceae bacterium]OQY78255.1 MAG: 50S ribosomal protei